jgi:hypothetical protein
LIDLSTCPFRFAIAARSISSTNSVIGICSRLASLYKIEIKTSFIFGEYMIALLSLLFVMVSNSGRTNGVHGNWQKSPLT